MAGQSASRLDSAAMKLRRIGISLLALCAGCQGPVLLYSEDEMATMAVKAYAEETAKYKVITGTKDAEMVARVGRKIADASGKDYEWEGEAATLSNMKNPMRGCGPFVHDDEADRPPDVFGGKVTLHMDRRRPAHVLLPVIPATKR